MAHFESPEDVLIREEILERIMWCVDSNVRKDLLRFAGGLMSEKRAAIALHTARREARLKLGITGY